jgi:hypothetical protein
MRPLLQHLIAFFLSPLFDEDFDFLRGLVTALSAPNELGSFIHVISDFDGTEGPPRPQMGGSRIIVGITSKEGLHMEVQVGLSSKYAWYPWDRARRVSTGPALTFTRSRG